MNANASETEIVGSIHSLKGTAAGAGDLAARLALLEGKSTAEREADKIISEAHSAGKLTESMVEWAKKEVAAGRIDQLKGLSRERPSHCAARSAPGGRRRLNMPRTVAAIAPLCLLTTSASSTSNLVSVTLISRSALQEARNW